ncbi:MAG TPA: hypothetical protein VGB02_16035 [Pyrinomonadaceae bacterium]|jgi:hypothetical protein
MPAVPRFLQLTLVCLVVCAAQTAAQDVAYVLEVKGNWYLTTARENALRQGQRLPASGVIRSKSPTPDDLLVVADLRGEIIRDLNCRRNQCSKSIVLPEGNPKPGFLSGIYNSAMALIWGSPHRYSIHRSRGENLLDGVVRLDGDKIDLSPILQTPGKYHLRWRKIPASDGEKIGEWLETITTESSDKQTAIASTAKLTPGLYEVNSMQPRGKYLEATPVFAWVLVSSPTDYEKTSAAFAEAVGKTKQWDKQVSDATAAVFLQAILDALAQDTTKNEMPTK